MCYKENEGEATYDCSGYWKTRWASSIEGFHNLDDAKSAIRESNGRVVSVTDKGIKAACYDLIVESIVPEATAAVSRSASPEKSLPHSNRYRDKVSENDGEITEEKFIWIKARLFYRDS